MTKERAAKSGHFSPASSFTSLPPSPHHHRLLWSSNCLVNLVADDHLDTLHSEEGLREEPRWTCVVLSGAPNVLYEGVWVDPVGEQRGGVTSDKIWV
ncbi:hypothetical protein OsI_16067 [Oryza sativa Indica Group]|uniref:Uncharacterized protein n=1 Tax=Oryza sativa subsp. indica TaxID=39946 RepID=B8AUD2_ORYSI|nr:hypothetical protein OsI_16067 [Oryza sativa Indica Group]